MTGMQVLEVQTRPFHRLRFLNAGKRGGREVEHLPFVTGKVDVLPAGLEALLLTSDLQGVVKGWDGTSHLLGEALVAEYRLLADAGRVPSATRVGVILAGDFYSAPSGDVRGASGDVSGVWQAFASAFAQVVGVQGNHDTFGEGHKTAGNVDLLDVDGVNLLDLHVAGVGGVMGDPLKPLRREETDYLAAVELVLEYRPNILVLHEAPSGGCGQRGKDALTRLLQPHPQVVTVCGHVHWDEPLCRLPGGHTILNVDKRVILLKA